MKKHTKEAHPGAWISSKEDKGRMKMTIDNQVYLGTDESFYIELYNPYDYDVICSIKNEDTTPTNQLNISSEIEISPKGGILIKSNERMYYGTVSGTDNELTINNIKSHITDYTGFIYIEFWEKDGGLISETYIQLVDVDNKPMDSQDVDNMNKLCQKLSKSYKHIDDISSSMFKYHDLFREKVLSKSEYETVSNYIKDELKKHVWNKKVDIVELPDVLFKIKDLERSSLIESGEFEIYKNKILSKL